MENEKTRRRIVTGMFASIALLGVQAIIVQFFMLFVGELFGVYFTDVRLMLITLALVLNTRLLYTVKKMFRSLGEISTLVIYALFELSVFILVPETFDSNRLKLRITYFGMLSILSFVMNKYVTASQTGFVPANKIKDLLIRNRK